MRDVKWVNLEEVNGDERLLSGVQVSVLNVTVEHGGTEAVNKPFVFAIFKREEEYLIFFQEEEKYIKYITNDKEYLFTSTPETPFLFREAGDNKDFLAKESNDPELYHIVTSMIVDKLYEIKQEAI